MPCILEHLRAFCNCNHYLMTHSSEQRSRLFYRCRDAKAKMPLHWAPGLIGLRKGRGLERERRVLAGPVQFSS